MVDDEPTFNEVYLLFEQWRKSEGLTGDETNLQIIQFSFLH